MGLSRNAQNAQECTRWALGPNVALESPKFSAF